MQKLTHAQCWALLSSHVLGRLAVSVAGQPEIFPVNYVTHEEHIVFRTAEGTKLASVAANARVAFETDGYDAATGEAWSVVVHGIAHVLRDFDEIYPAQDLDLTPWSPSLKSWFVRIRPHETTGRRFAVVADQRPSTDLGT